jgi:D-arabinose 5-phosphate isomerase GutQ
MPIGAWVVTLSDGPRDEALAARLADPRLTLGEATRNRLPVVVETVTLAEGEALFEALSAERGVVFVDVVSVDFSDLEGDADRGQA